MTEHIFHHFLAGKRVAILGFGQEGRSTFTKVRQYLPDLPLHICDRNPSIREDSGELQNDPLIQWHTGNNYPQILSDVDIIIKSPGVPLRVLEHHLTGAHLTSQTELFVSFFRQQITGITGTKGKSTTSALLHHILAHSGKHSLLIGNIGVPPLDMADQVRPETHVVYEMSSHQLENMTISPQYAVMLNIFQEHLDHYPSFQHYQQAKMNISKWQAPSDTLLYNAENIVLRELINNSELHQRKIMLSNDKCSKEHVRFEGNDLVIALEDHHTIIPGLGSISPLPGQHNLLNVAAAACMATIHGVSIHDIMRAVKSFKGLPHRLELAASYKGWNFYNDSISTIPESAIAAVEALPGTTTLILGGYDRDIEYEGLIRYLESSNVTNIIFNGEAGRRMYEMSKHRKGFVSRRCILAGNFDEAFEQAASTILEKGNGICLLSPAAASYDEFKNFRERGDRFRALANVWIKERRKNKK